MNVCNKIVRVQLPESSFKLIQIALFITLHSFKFNKSFASPHASRSLMCARLKKEEEKEYCYGDSFDHTDTVDFLRSLKIARGNSGNPFLVRQIVPRYRTENRTAAHVGLSFPSSIWPRVPTFDSSGIRGPGFN